MKIIIGVALGVVLLGSAGGGAYWWQHRPVPVSLEDVRTHVAAQSSTDWDLMIADLTARPTMTDPAEIAHVRDTLCVRAGLAAEANLQARNTTQYKFFKTQELEFCK